MNVFGTLGQIFRDRSAFLSGVKKSADLPGIFKTTAIIWGVVSALCGIVMGVPGGVYQMLLSGIKLPLLLGLAALVSLPVVYFYCLYFKARLTVYQLGALLSAMLVVVGVLSLAFAPALLVLWISVGDYGLYKLACVAVLALNGILGVLFLKQGLEGIVRGGLGRPREAFFWMWAALFALVGGQLAWLMRPFIGDPEASFQVFAGVGGSLYQDVARTFWNLLLSVL